MQRHQADTLGARLALAHPSPARHARGNRRALSNSSMKRISSFRFSSRTGACGRLVGLPHRGVAGLVEDQLGELGVAHGLDQRRASARRRRRDRRAPCAASAVSSSVSTISARRLRTAARRAARASSWMRLQRGVAEAALRHVDDALEVQDRWPAWRDAEISDRVPDLLALVEARAADDAIGQPERDEALFEGAHLEARRARGSPSRSRLVPWRCSCLDVVADPARLLLVVPDAGPRSCSPGVAVGEQRLAEPALVVRDQARGGGEDMAGRAVVAFEADDLGAGKVLLEAQDVVDLGAAPAVDRLVVVADAADVAASPAPSSRSQRYCATLVS